jgi:CRP-like cAMP-binding protein
VTHASVDALLRSHPPFARLAQEARARLAAIASARAYERGATIFREGEASELLITIASGRVKVVKMLPAAREMIVEILGPGDPLGVVAAYEDRPYPASAVALEPTECLLFRRAPFFALLEADPGLTRGLLAGLSLRIVQLTQRLTELAGARVEARFALLFLKLSERLGRPVAGGALVPLALSRQDLADLTGTTVESCIRIMSRWGKQGLVRTETEGFVVVDPDALRRLAE